MVVKISKGLILFLLILIIGNAEAQNQGLRLTARWNLNNDFDYLFLSQKILNSVDQQKIIAYDSVGKAVPSSDILSWVSLAQRSYKFVLTLEESAIAIGNGDLSPFAEVKSTLSLKQLTAMQKQYSSPSYYNDIQKTLSYRTAPLDYNALTIDIEENIILDTTRFEQRGEFQYLVCRVDYDHTFYLKYSDLKQVNLKEELKALKDRNISVSNGSGNLVLKFKNTELSFDSQFNEDQDPDVTALNNTLFKYFKSQLRLHARTSGRRISW